MKIFEVKCEQFNANDHTYDIAEILFNSGDFVNEGELLFELDSSKALIEVESKFTGFFYTKYNRGNNVAVNSILYLISDTEITDYNSFFDETISVENIDLKDDKVYTLKAKEFVEKNNVDTSLIEETFVTLELLQNRFGKKDLILESCNVNKIFRVAIIGAGKGLIQVLDIIFNSNKYIPVCIYDDTPDKQSVCIFNVPVVGVVNHRRILEDFENGKFDCIINSVSTSIEFRKNTFNKLKEYNIPFANLIHDKAIIGFNVDLGEGNIILADVVIGTNTRIGNNNFISSKCNIEHHNILGDHITFGPNVVTSGSVEIGDEVKFGTGVFIEPNVIIGNNCVISSGSFITKNIPTNTIVLNENLNIKFKTINR